MNDRDSQVPPQRATRDRVREAAVPPDTRVAGSRPSPRPMPPSGPAPGIADTNPEQPIPAASAPGRPAPTGSGPTGLPPGGSTPADALPRLTGSDLLDKERADRLRQRWREVQSGFVDDPGEAVRRADALTGEAVEAIAEALNAQRRELDSRARTGSGEPDTERLRQTLRAYREFLDRVLAT
ncbi:hypothetical protein [Spirillospora sp. CA-294931]|uniref:hypothetical protein n=1 Tax=Spirillospora sp. CA-294931 TaxID=3240042 RepID=UPI003D8FAB36